MTQEKPITILWSVHAYGADWRSTAFVERFVQGAIDARAIGQVETLALGEDDTQRPVDGAATLDLPAYLSKSFWSVPGTARMEARGREPFAWTLTASYLPSPPNAESIGGLTLTFDAHSESDPSEVLWARFHELHTPANTLVAFIHPARRFSVDRTHADPIVSTASLESIWWANYVSPRTLERFDVSRLDSDDGVAEWSHGQGLFIRVTPSIFDFISSDGRKRAESLRKAIVRRFVSAKPKR